MTRVLLVAVVALTLTGCAGASQAGDVPQWQKDYLDCVMDLGDGTNMSADELQAACEASVSK